MTGTDAPFLRTLCSLRWLAVAGQAATILVATSVLGLELPQLPLWAGVAALTLFNLYAQLRVANPAPFAGLFRAQGRAVGTVRCTANRWLWPRWPSLSSRNWRSARSAPTSSASICCALAAASCPARPLRTVHRPA